MADFIYGQAAGKFAEWAARVNANDPANSAFIIMALATAGTDANLRDLDTFAAIEAEGSTSEQSGGTYARKTLTDASSITITIDDSNNRTDIDCPDQTWTGLTVTAGVITDLVFGYDSDTTGGTDANIIPMSQHDFSLTPDGSDVTATIAVFARATAT